jgi:hypothetical protein
MSHASSSTTFPELTVTWEKLPADFQLPDEPVENTDHPLLAAALREALEIAGFITSNMLIASNFGLCANVDDKTIVKAPDWLYVASVAALKQGEVRRSYTPHAEGDVPTIVGRSRCAAEKLHGPIKSKM